MLVNADQLNAQSSESLRRDGFTLIELLIVIVILGILSAVVVLAVGAATESADASACAIDRRTVLTAYEAYVAEEGGTPTMSDLVNARWLSTPSTNYDLTGSPLPGGNCV